MLTLTAAEMQACDRATTERFGVPSLELMRAASAAVADLARTLYPQARRLLVLCGRGNNGGDGMMAARLLASSGCAVTLLLLGSPEGLKGDAATAWRELEAAPGVVVHAIATSEELEAQEPLFAGADLILDAVVGTGFTPPLRGLPLAALERLRHSAAPVLAVDLPSGWGADLTEAEPSAPVFPADAVVTFTAPKPAHLFGQLTRRWDQPVVVAPIGSPEAAILSTLGLRWAGSSLALAQQPRPRAANKGSFGHVLVVGGAVGKSGAPAMAALAALRAGAGLVTAAVPEPTLPLVLHVAPELMGYPLPATPGGAIAAMPYPEQSLTRLLERKSVLALGPGLGEDPESAEFLLALLEGSCLPAVLDADALNLLARHPGELRRIVQLAPARPIVLTPHPGEMSRLTGQSVAQIQADRLGAARRFALEQGVTVVLKGARTVIAHPDGRAAVNTSGNPGMAKGGSGDVLTGMIAALLAQHPDEPSRAVEAAVCLHGLAADLRVRRTDERTLLATDGLRELSRAFRFPWRTPNGYLWIQGTPVPTASEAAS